MPADAVPRRPRAPALALVPLLVFSVVSPLWPGAAPSARSEEEEQSKPEESVFLSVALPEGPMVGARLFAQKSCVRCHTLVGGAPQIGPDLGRLVFDGNVLDLAGTFWNHAPIMHEKMRELNIPMPALSSSEMADIVALLTVYRHVTNTGESDNVAAGRKVFEAKGCSGCHGAHPSREPSAPDLTRFSGRYSAIYLVQAMWNHAPTMATAMRQRGLPWPKFAGTEMADLAAYLQTGGTSTERVYFEPGSPRQGRELFKSKRCIACHAIGGAGGSGGPDLATGAQRFRQSVVVIAGLMWNHSQGMTDEFGRRAIPRAMFSGQEMADIIAYIHFVNYANLRAVPTRGEEVFAAKCSRCHSVGVGRRLGPDLAMAPNLDDPMALIAAMWNHSPGMEGELLRRGLTWPRLERGEPADLAAFILASRAAAAKVSPSMEP